MLILGLVEEIGEMARAYLAKHGRKKLILQLKKMKRMKMNLGIY